MSTFSKLRVGPKRASAGSPLLVIKFDFDPTAASANSGYTLPKNAVITGIKTIGNGTGGTTPTIAVGTSADNDAYVDDADADAGTVDVAPALATWNTALTADTAVYAGAGDTGTDATGGTATAIIEYYLDDPLNGVNN